MFYGNTIGRFSMARSFGLMGCPVHFLPKFRR